MINPRRRRYDDTLIFHIAKYVGVATVIIGGVVAFGNNFWASKVAVGQIQTDVAVMKNDMGYLKDIAKETVVEIRALRKEK